MIRLVKSLTKAPTVHSRRIFSVKTSNVNLKLQKAEL